MEAAYSMCWWHLHMAVLFTVEPADFQFSSAAMKDCSRALISLAHMEDGEGSERA